MGKGGRRTRTATDSHKIRNDSHRIRTPKAFIHADLRGIRRIRTIRGAHTRPNTWRSWIV